MRSDIVHPRKILPEEGTVVQLGVSRWPAACNRFRLRHPSKGRLFMKVHTGQIKVTRIDLNIKMT